jgi:hypothetical protein
MHKNRFEKIVSWLIGKNKRSGGLRGLGRVFRPAAAAVDAWIVRLHAQANDDGADLEKALAAIEPQALVELYTCRRYYAKDDVIFDEHGTPMFYRDRCSSDDTVYYSYGTGATVYWMGADADCLYRFDGGLPLYFVGQQDKPAAKLTGDAAPANTPSGQ